MTTLVAAFALLIMTMSVYGFIKPQGYVAFARWLDSGPALWGAAALRLALAVVLWLAADASRTPTTFKVLAVVAVLGAMTLPVMGRERFRRLFDWGAAQPPLLLRALCALGVGFGLFLLWSSRG